MHILQLPEGKINYYEPTTTQVAIISKQGNVNAVIVNQTTLYRETSLQINVIDPTLAQRDKPNYLRHKYVNKSLKKLSNKEKDGTLYLKN